MLFKDIDHQQFYEQRIKELEQYRQLDSYYNSLIYTLAICDTTRNNFKNIFNMQEGTINIESLEQPYQTSTSMKVTRLAFCLFNSCMYDNDYDFVNKKVSKYYGVDEIFACDYAPYFYQAVKLRFPQYTKN